jgi:hypothetical protein
MDGITEGIGGAILPDGMTLRTASRRLRGDPGSRVAARMAAERLRDQYPWAEVRAARLRDCDGLEAVAGGQRVTGTVEEVEAWLRKEKAAGTAAHVSAAGTDDADG